MLRIIGRTGTYIPLAPFLLEILDSAEFKKSNPKATSLKPLDPEYVIRAPNSYLKSRVYQETLADELTYIMGEFFALMSRNVSFPEMTIPVLSNLRRFLKKGAGSGKSKAQIKTVVEKIEATRIWVEKKRRGVNFAPNERQEVEAFMEGVRVEESPIGSWMRLQKKVRDQRRQEIEAVSAFI
jgi:nucleolar complex protein 2